MNHDCVVVLVEQALNYLVTTLLGGHHHHHHHQTEDVVGRSTTRANTTNSKVDVDSLHDEPQGDDNEEDHPAATVTTETIPPGCICHDDHPAETLDTLQHMAESMKAHPDRPHPPPSVQQPQPQRQTNRPENQEHNIGDNEEPEEHKEEIAAESGTAAAVKNSSATTTRINEDDDNNKDLQDELEDDDEDDQDEEGGTVSKNNRKLMVMSLNTALAIGLHNFPEGLATFVAALDDPKVGAVLAIAIAIHNIPEGLCVAMPIYYATGNKWKAFGWACLSGIAEPIAGLFGWIVLAQSFSNQLYALLFGMVAGMMVIISVRELLPTAHRYDPDDSVVTYCFIGGMGIMALSLMLFLL